MVPLVAASPSVRHPLEEPDNLFTRLKPMYRPVVSHGDREDAIKLGDLVAIEDGKGFVVSGEEGGYLERFHLALPLNLYPPHQSTPRCRPTGPMSPSD
jgi:hypothetical protein